ncbi:MAG: electron transport complex subunit E [Clostridiales bacterium]|nr:electron transport complex subunit E [Clostridiales bacterium]
MKACWERIYNGIIKENPAFILMLGMCPTLAVTTSAINGLGMGLSSLVVLAISNVVISLLRKVIPDEVRLPAFIVIVASFVTVVELLMEAYMESLYASLGIYIPLIVVNCIILGRAEAYASKNPPLLSLFDGLGMGLGFTVALVIIGSVRELLGAGSIFGIALPGNFEPIAFFVRAPGAFLVLAVVVAIMNAVGIKNRANKVVEGCDGCCASCASSGCDKKEAKV